MNTIFHWASSEKMARQSGARMYV